MKKYLAFVSVLGLTACGGGSGGGAMFAVPRAAVTPDSQTVDSNSGLSMVDINKVRANKYQQAMATVRAIEGGYDVDTNFIINRSATLAKNAGMRGATLAGDSSEEPDITMDEAYALMHDILMDRDVNGKTNHEILIALALTGMDSDEILDLLGYNQSGNEALDSRISDLVDALLLDEEHRTEVIQNLMNDAAVAYRDFGSHFDLTLEDARFGTSSSGGRDFTFVFDENGNVASINELWEGGRQYNAVGGGKFEADVLGTEYSIVKNILDDDGHPVQDDNGNYQVVDAEITVNNNGNSIPVDTKVYPDGANLPTATEIRNALKTNALGHFDEDNNPTEVANISAWFEDAPVIAYGQSCPRAEGCIMYVHVDYNDSITVESKGQSLGLRYSDFGLKLDKTVVHDGDGRYPGITYQEHTVFAGGYDGSEDDDRNKRVTPGQAMSFTGTAFAGVTRKSNNWEQTGLENYHEPEVNYYNGTATLTVAEDPDDNNTLKENLVADFSREGWYRVDVTGMNLGGNGGGQGGNITFTGTPTDDRFVVDQSLGEMEQSYTRYYGPDSATTTEAVGVVQYVERDTSVYDNAVLGNSNLEGLYGSTDYEHWIAIPDSDRDLESDRAQYFRNSVIIDNYDETDWTFKADISFGGNKVVPENVE